MAKRQSAKLSVAEQRIAARGICKLRGFHIGPNTDKNRRWPCYTCGTPAAEYDTGEAVAGELYGSGHKDWKWPA